MKNPIEDIGQSDLRSLHTNRSILRSETMQEIISMKQGFLSRWALLIFSIILLSLLTATWFIRYPDIVQAQAILTAANAPKEIVTRQEGKVVKIFVANNDPVNAGQLIAWMESTGDHRGIINLSALLGEASDLLSRNKTEKVSRIFAQPFQNLGEIQSPYQQFVAALQQFNDYLVNGYYYKRKRVLLADLQYLKNAYSTTEKEKKLAEQDLQVTQETFDSSASLFRDKVLSNQDMRDQKSKLVGKELSIPQLENSLLAIGNQEVSKQKDIDELEHTISQQKIIFQQALQTMKSVTEDWLIKYVISAPIEGKVVFIIPLQQNQFLPAGKIIGYINPPNSQYYAQIILPQSNFGKMDTGEKVQLRFDAYPYQEFGFVEGKLHYISNVPSDSGFLANIELTNGLTTNYNKIIQYRSGLKSQALIITKDLRLLQRFYYSVVKGVQR